MKIMKPIQTKPILDVLDVYAHFAKHEMVV